MHWWCCFELGIWDSHAYMVYSLVIFAFTVMCIGIMLCAGASTNKIARKRAFYKMMLEEEKAKRKAKEDKDKADATYTAKREAAKAKAASKA